MLDSSAGARQIEAKTVIARRHLSLALTGSCTKNFIVSPGPGFRLPPKATISCDREYSAGCRQVPVSSAVHG